MPEPLWQWPDLVAAARGEADGTPALHLTGFSIDSRSIEPGDVFVALRDARDGHEFVPAAFRAGAAAAVVSRGYGRGQLGGALLRVGDPLGALEAIGRAARMRCNARIAAVTGSVGKTGTKEMLRLCLGQAGATHAAEKSYNNHWGVPLTLARMPADSEYAVFELGMNHAGEITPLAQMVRPHVALITTVEPVHLGHFGSVEEIAAAKAEIFAGLVPGGTAILPRDNPHFELLRERALAVGAKIITFGYHAEADFRALQVDLGPKGSSVIAGHDTQRFPYRVGAPGEHYVKNSLAVLAGLQALGADAMRCLPALARVSAPAGRGARTLLDVPDGGTGGHILLIDESYNANPASVRAALAAMATTPREAFGRRIAVLGDMLELGDAAAELHRGLKEAIDAAGIDLVLACGPMMKLMFDDLPRERQGTWAPHSQELAHAVVDTVRAGDVAMIKGSLGTRMAPIVDAMLARFGPGGLEGRGMLYALVGFSEQIGPLNVFRYITFRTGGAIMTALLFVFLFGPAIIDLLRVKQGKGQPIREDGPATHFAKVGTPTMGGLMILSGVTVSTLLWANWANWYVWIVLFVTLSYGVIGFYDDYLKVSRTKTAGFSGSMRLLGEVVVAAIAAWAVMRAGSAGFSSSLTVPFFKTVIIPLGGVFVLLGVIVIAGAGNAVNLTDGLDGLAIVPVMIAAATFGLIAYLTGNANFARYLQIHHVAGAGELAVVCGALIGAGLGFLWFNAPPAMIFMGDTGSLALGGALGAIAVATKHEIVLAIVGGLFVLETMSVIIQVTSFKLTGKRVFRMAPLHHHFEQKGWKESTVVVRFWIISVVLALIGLATLKLR